MIRRPPRSTLFPYTTALPISEPPGDSVEREIRRRAGFRSCRQQLSRAFAVLSRDRKSTRLNSSHTVISYAVFCLKKKKNKQSTTQQKHLTERTLVRPTQAPTP